MLELLSIVPVIMLAFVTIWFLWPIVVDPIVAAIGRHSGKELDGSTEDIFETWLSQRNTVYLLDGS